MRCWLWVVVLCGVAVHVVASTNTLIDDDDEDDVEVTAEDPVALPDEENDDSQGGDTMDTIDDPGHPHAQGDADAGPSLDELEEAVESFFHTAELTNNWVVIVSTSKYWFNYRHNANALSIYHTVKRLGIPDTQILLMLSDGAACDARNAFPATVYGSPDHRINLYGQNVEVDYRGYDVTVENFLRLLTGRHEPHVPISKRLMTNEESNVLVYLTGHGGDEFLKFQDAEEVSSQDIADAFRQMHEQHRYRDIFFIADTCQAATLHTQFESPNIVAVGSSLKNQNSYSLMSDSRTGVATIDRFTYWTLDFLQHVQATSKTSLAELFTSYDPVQIRSNPEVKSDQYPRTLEEVPLTEFFSARVPVYATPAAKPFVDIPEGAPYSAHSSPTYRPHTFQPLHRVHPGVIQMPPAPHFRFTWRVGVAVAATLCITMAVSYCCMDRPPPAPPRLTPEQYEAIVKRREKLKRREQRKAERHRRKMMKRRRLGRRYDSSTDTDGSTDDGLKTDTSEDEDW